MACKSKCEHLGDELLVVQTHLRVGGVVGLNYLTSGELHQGYESVKQRDALTEDAHHVLAVDLPFGIHVCTLFSENLLAICPEEVVEVAHTGVWIHGDVSGQLEDRVRDVVPASAE